MGECRETLSYMLIRILLALICLGFITACATTKPPSPVDQSSDPAKQALVASGSCLLVDHHPLILQPMQWSLKMVVSH